MASQGMVLTLEPGKSLHLRSGSSYTILVDRPASIALQLFDHLGQTPLADLDYRLEGEDGSSRSGRTDAQGRLSASARRCPHVLRVVEPGSGREVAVGVPWTVDPARPHLQHVRGFLGYKLFCELRDETGRQPLAHEPCRVSCSGGRLRLVTDGLGRLRLGPLPLSSCRLEVRGSSLELFPVPYFEEEPHLQHVRGVSLSPPTKEPRP